MRDSKALVCLTLSVLLLSPLRAASSVVLVEDTRSSDGFVSVGPTPVSNASTIYGPGDFSVWVGNASVTATDYTCNPLCYGTAGGSQYRSRRASGKPDTTGAPVGVEENLAAS